MRAVATVATALDRHDLKLVIWKRQAVLEIKGRHSLRFYRDTEGCYVKLFIVIFLTKEKKPKILVHFTLMKLFSISLETPGVRHLVCYIIDSENMQQKASNWYYLDAYIALLFSIVSCDAAIIKTNHYI